jgi:hypothetical protein
MSDLCFTDIHVFLLFTCNDPYERKERITQAVGPLPALTKEKETHWANAPCDTCDTETVSVTERLKKKDNGD